MKTFFHSPLNKGEIVRQIVVFILLALVTVLFVLAVTGKLAPQMYGYF